MSDLLVRKIGRVGRITLNRPEVLNALSHDMCLGMETALTEWAEDATVDIIVVDATGEKAFCAGGDIVKIYTEGVAGNFEGTKQFWRDEYRLNLLIATYPKPYVVVMDGFVMGGGVGISAHGSHRVVTERTLFAMPECAIGLMPDVGGTLLLANTPDHCGEYIGLTGARLSGADCIFAGLADVFVPSKALPEMVQLLQETGDIAALQQYFQDVEPSNLQANLKEINKTFGQRETAEIVNGLISTNTDFAVAALKGFNRGAPASQTLFLNALRQARAHGSLEQALETEYEIVVKMLEQGDFLEGIRAAVIEKDITPNWGYSP